MEQVAYHCAILEEGGYLSKYESNYADNELSCFAVGRLTWEGHDFLDNIKEPSEWERTKSVMKESGLPFAMGIIKKVASGIFSKMAQELIEKL